MTSPASAASQALTNENNEPPVLANAEFPAVITPDNILALGNGELRRSQLAMRQGAARRWTLRYGRRTQSKGWRSWKWRATNANSNGADE